MKIVQKGKRKAISPVLATVILIAITLIAAVAIAGFVFGLFGSFTSSAQVSVTVSSCKFTSLTGAVCNLSATNSGTSNAVSTVCAINLDGAARQGVTSAGAGGSTTIGAGINGDALVCTVAYITASTGQSAGSQAVGSISLSNGASAPFSGVWS